MGILLLHSFETLGYIFSGGYATEMKSYFSEQDMATDESWARFVEIVASLSAGSAAILLLLVWFRVRRWRSREKRYSYCGSIATSCLFLMLMFELTATIHALMWVPKLLPNGPEEIGKTARLLAIMMCVLMSVRALDVGLFVLVDKYLNTESQYGRDA